MYNEQLEELIDAALEDGVLTEKEKQVLFKKAQSMGVDLDEFEMVLDARLVKIQKAEKEKQPTSAPKSIKIGDVKKCPACGAIVQSFHGICHECGYAFENVMANSSVMKLAEKLEKNGKYEDEEDYEKMATIIKNFPIPTAKADIMELIMLIQTQLSALKGQNSAGVYRDACLAKLKECSLKTTLYFPDDKQLQNLINETNNINTQIEKSIKQTNIKNTILGAVLLVVALFIGYKIWGLQWKVVWRIITMIYTSFPVAIWGLTMMIDKKD